MLCITVPFCLCSVNQLLYPLTSSMRYAHSFRGEQIQCNGTMRVQKYKCRLRKSRSSSTTKVATEGKVIKRAVSVSIYVMFESEFLGLSVAAVIIECLDEHTHTHDIEESFHTKNQAPYAGISSLRQPKITPQLRPRALQTPTLRVHTYSVPTYSNVKSTCSY